MADQPPVNDLQTIQKNVNDIVQRIFDQCSDENSGVTIVSIEKKIKTKKDLALLAFDLFDNLNDVKSALATIAKNKLKKKKIDVAKDQQLKECEDKCEELERKIKSQIDESSQFVRFDKIDQDLQDIKAQLNSTGEQMTKSLEELSAKDTDLKKTVVSYADAVNADAKKREAVKAPTVDKKAIKQAWAESRKEDERQRSIIVSGMPYSDEGELTAESIFKKILEELDLDHVHLQVVSVALIGKEYTRDSESDDEVYRLVRITFTSRQAANLVISKSRNLKKSKKYSHTYINPDHTRSEREKIKTLVQQMKVKIAEDPSVYWRISDMKLVSSVKKPGSSLIDTISVKQK